MSSAVRSEKKVSVQINPIHDSTGVPLSGTPHLQGYVYFKHPKTLSAVKSLIPRAHLEVSRARDPQAAIDYAKKDGEYDDLEFGEAPTSPKRKGELERERWQAAWDIAKNGGDLEDIDADIRVRQYATLKKIRADYQLVPASTDELDFWWYVGPSGAGASHVCLAIA